MYLSIQYERKLRGKKPDKFSTAPKNKSKNEDVFLVQLRKDQSRRCCFYLDPGKLPV